MNSNKHPHFNGMSRLELADASTFHKQFWANQEAFEAMISRSPPVIQAHPFVRGRLGLADDTDGQVVILSEYLTTLKHLQKLYNDPLKRGVILTGSPGIGKSYSLVYFIHWCLAHRFPFLFTTSWRLTLFFDAQGIWKFDRDFVYRLTEFTEDNNLNPDPSSKESWRPWSFIDSGEATPPSFAVTDIFNVFPVFAAPPDPSRYKVWRNKFYSRVITLIMNVPSRKELSQLSAVQQISPRIRPQQLEDAIRVAGPCPRDLFAHLHGMSSRRHLNDYLQHTNMGEILLLVPQLLRPNSYMEISHCIFILVREKRTELLQDDEISIDFKSRHIRDKIWQKQRLLDFKSALRLYNTHRVTPQTTSLGAWIFESLAVHITSGSVPYQTHKLAGGFHAMTRNFNPLASLREILLHDENGARIITRLPIVQDPLLYFSPSSTNFTTLLFPVAKREPTTFSPDHLAGISLDPTAYYVPSTPLYAFDAFFLDIADDGVFTIWILQMTKVERQQNLISEGNEVIKELRTMCEKKVGMVSLKYVLVTPGPANEDRTVTWRVPGEWQDDEDDLQGEIYVQFISGDDLLPTMVF